MTQQFTRMPVGGDDRWRVPMVATVKRAEKRNLMITPIERNVNGAAQDKEIAPPREVELQPPAAEAGAGQDGEPGSSAQGKLRDLLAHLPRVRTAWDLEQRYQLGKLLVEAKDDLIKAYDSRRYGAKVLPWLHEQQDLDKTLIYHLIKFAELFDYAKVKYLAELERQRKISWSHVRGVLRVKDESTRWDLIERVVLNGWTPEQLGEVIRGLNGGTKSRRGRRRGSRNARRSAGGTTGTANGAASTKIDPAEGDKTAYGS
jgi:hypothetical protein